MTPADQALLARLLTETRVLALAVTVEGRPVIGMLPFALMPDYSAALIHASRLAKHSAGLLPDAPYSALIHGPDDPTADPLQLPRVHLEGHVQPLDKTSEDYAKARAIYLTRFPSSEMIFTLGDFNLYALTIDHGRLVAGFARAFNLSADLLRGLA